MSDGFKDYDKVSVVIRKGYIASIAPNPVLSTTTILYNLENVTSASLILFGNNALTSHSYSLSMSGSSCQIDMTNLMPGSYFVAIVCDGVITDVKAISKL
ncbi:MAG: hypothetical protein JSS78_07660 [Bacteroidetes bacterium]|nr:hypothetical protein [Bacteroidota bacterium]